MIIVSFYNVRGKNTGGFMKKLVILFLLFFFNKGFCQNWIQSKGLYGTDVRAISVTKNDVIFISSMQGIFRSSDYCNTWNRVLDIQAMYPIFQTNTGAIIFDDWRSVDQGINWSQTQYLGIRSFAENSNNEIFGVAYQGKIYKSTDDGLTWNLIFQIANEDFLNSITIDNNGNIYIGTQKINGQGVGDIYKSTDDGISWNIILDSSIQNYGIVYKVFNDSNGTIYASTSSPTGGLISSSNGGATWNKIMPTISLDAFVKDGNIFSACSSAGVFVSTDNGKTWNQKNYGMTLPNIYSINHTSNNYIIAGDGSTGIYLSTDSGNSWTKKNTGIDGLNINSLIETNNGFVFATGIGVRISNDYGLSWSDINNLATWTYGITADSKGNIYATDGIGIDKSTDNGLSWSSETNGFNWSVVFSVKADMNDNLYAATQSSGIYKSTDYGENWQQVLSDNENFHSLLIDKKGDIFAGSWSNGVYCSTNGGSSWNNISNGLPTDRIQELASDSDDNIYATTFSNGLYKKEYNTSTWTKINCPLAYSQLVCTNNSNVIFVTTMWNSASGIFYSTDEGSTWGQIPGLNQNISINDIYCDKNGYVLLSTSRGVFRTQSSYLNIFSLISPSQNQNNLNPSMNFTWGKAANASNYNLQVSTTSDFANPIIDITTPNTSYSLQQPLLYNNGYYWRVRPEIDNSWGEWTSTWYFTTEEKPITVRYQCNMQIEELGGRFNPNTDYVELRGVAFGDWGPGVRMQQDPNNPYLYYYEATQYLSAGDSLPEYKFWYSTNDTWEYGSNRTYIVTQQDVDNGKILLSRFFDDLTFSTVTNTSTKILYTIDTKNAHDVFGNPITVPINTLDLNGSSIPLTWNGWIYNDINDMSPMYDDGTHGDSIAGDGIYSREVVFNPYTPFHVEYEYVINFVQSGFIPYENASGDNHIINLEQNLYSATAYNVYGFMSSVTGITPLVDKVYLPRFELNNADTLLTRLLTNTNKDLNEALSKASTELNNSLDTSYWADNLNLNEKGQKVFEDTKKAAEELITSLKKGMGNQIIQPIIDDIYYGDLYIVDILLDELKNNSMNSKVANNNDDIKDKNNRFNSIQKELSDAGLKYSKGNYAEAIEEIKSAWQDLMDISREQNQIMDKRSLVENKGIEMNNLPKEFKLNQNYPNPFNPTTTINYSVPTESFVTLKVYDVLGNEVSSLVNEDKNPGYYSVQLSAVSNKLASGIYFYRMQAGNFSETKKLILMK